MCGYQTQHPSRTGAPICSHPACSTWGTHGAGAPTLVVQLEGPHCLVLEGAEVDRDGVGGAADDLALHQQRLVSQHHQCVVIHATDGKHLPV